jgi:hypothetical protein
MKQMLMIEPSDLMQLQQGGTLQVQVSGQDIFLSMAQVPNGRERAMAAPLWPQAAARTNGSGPGRGYRRPDTVYRCTVCDPPKRFPNQGAYMRHRGQLHPEFIGGRGRRSLVTQRGGTPATRTHHTDGKAVHCATCKAGFDTRGEMMQHKISVHAYIGRNQHGLAKRDDPKHPSRGGEMRHPGRAFTCHLCDPPRKFSDQSKYMKHQIRKHRGGRIANGLGKIVRNKRAASA